MASRYSTIQKCAFGFAVLFLAVYSLDYVPGIMGRQRQDVRPLFDDHVCGCGPPWLWARWR